MRVRYNGEEVDAIPHGLSYANELLDGVFLDMDDDYAFLSANVPEHRELIEQIDEEYEHYDLTDCDVDYKDIPHKWVVQSVANIVIKSAIGMLEDSIE